MQFSSNKFSRDQEFSQSGFQDLGIQPIRFRGAENSTNQMLSVSRSRPIRFFQAGSSTNQKLSTQYSRPIRFRGAESSANQVISLSGSHPVRFFATGISGNQMEGPSFIIVGKLLCFFLLLNLWLVEKGYNLEELF